MKKFICILLTFTFSSAVVPAEDKKSPQVVTIGGKKWLAFEKEDAHKLLDMRVKFPKMDNLIDKQKELLSLRSVQISKYEELLSYSADQRILLTKANRELSEQIINSDKWYNNEWFWFSVGVILGVGCTTAIVVGAR